MAYSTVENITIEDNSLFYIESAKYDKEDVEEFVGLNGEKMGEFKKGEIVNLPREIAKILIDGGKAERV